MQDITSGSIPSSSGVSALHCWEEAKLADGGLLVSCVVVVRVICSFRVDCAGGIDCLLPRPVFEEVDW